MRRTDEIFTCEVCGKDFKSETACQQHVLGHDVIYVALERSELKMLVKSILDASYGGIQFDEKVVEKLLNYKIGITR